MKKSELLNPSFMGAGGHSQRNSAFGNILKCLRGTHGNRKYAVPLPALLAFFFFFRERTLLVVKDQLQKKYDLMSHFNGT